MGFMGSGGVVKTQDFNPMRGQTGFEQGGAYSDEEIRQGKHLGTTEGMKRSFTASDPSKFTESQGYVRTSDGKLIRKENLAKYEQDRAIKTQEGEIGKFKEGMPKLQESMTSDIMGSAKRDISRAQAGIGQEASRRGLLYSGMRQGAQADVAQAGSQMAAQKNMEMNTQLEDQRKKMEDTLAQMRIGKWEGEVQEADAAYKRALAESQANSGIMGGLIGGAGSIAGSYFGAKAGSK